MATETKEMKLYQEKLSIKIRQGYLTEANKKRIEQVAETILNSPIEEVSKHWFQLTNEWVKDDDEINEIISAVHAYPGIKTYVHKALILEMESGKIKPYVDSKCSCRPSGESVEVQLGVGKRLRTTWTDVNQDMKLYQEKLSFATRQGSLTEADKKKIERVAKAILDSPIEEVIKCWEHFSWGLRPAADPTEAMHFAVHAYPGVQTRLAEALTWKYGESE